jgi:hypothetical protein
MIPRCKTEAWISFQTANLCFNCSEFLLKPRHITSYRGKKFLLFRWHVAPCGKYSLTNPAEGCCALTHRGERHMRELNGGSTPKDE